MAYTDEGLVTADPWVYRMCFANDLNRSLPIGGRPLEALWRPTLINRWVQRATDRLVLADIGGSRMCFAYG